MGLFQIVCAAVHEYDAFLPSRSAWFSARTASWLLRFVSGAVIVFLILGGGVLHASEYGVGSYRPGVLDLFAGTLPAPGGVLVKNYFLFQDASLSVHPQNAPLRVNTHTVTYTNATFVVYTTPLRILGANWGMSVLTQTRIADQTLRVSVIGGPTSVERSTVGGFGDLIVSPLMLNWNFSNLHLVGALMLYAPTGSYDRRRIIDVGLNRWAIEPDLGVTWLDNESGRHASMFVGYTVNAENPSTHYVSGNEFHADFVLAQHLPHGLVAGIAGYAVQQTTADSGSGASLGAFKGRVIGLGPLVGVTVPIWKAPVSFSFKYDFEFAAQNRSTGNALWLTASLRL